MLSQCTEFLLHIINVISRLIYPPLVFCSLFWVEVLQYIKDLVEVGLYTLLPIKEAVEAVEADTLAYLIYYVEAWESRVSNRAFYVGVAQEDAPGDVLFQVGILQNNPELFYFMQYGMYPLEQLQEVQFITLILPLLLGLVNHFKEHLDLP